MRKGLLAALLAVCLAASSACMAQDASEGESEIGRASCRERV